MTTGQRAVIVLLIAVGFLELSLTKRLGTIWHLAFGGGTTAAHGELPDDSGPHGPPKSSVDR